MPRLRKCSYANAIDQFVNHESLLGTCDQRAIFPRSENESLFFLMFWEFTKATVAFVLSNEDPEGGGGGVTNATLLRVSVGQEEG